MVFLFLVVPQNPLMSIIGSWLSQNVRPWIPDPQGVLTSCKLQCIKVVPLEENSVVEFQGIDACTLDNSSSQNEVDVELERYKSLLAVLGKQWDQIRYLPKDDEEARIFMGANGVVEPLLQFLRLAVNDGDKKAQEPWLFSTLQLTLTDVVVDAFSKMLSLLETSNLLCSYFPCELWISLPFPFLTCHLSNTLSP